MSKHARRSAPGVFLAGVFLTLLAGVMLAQSAIDPTAGGNRPLVAVDRPDYHPGDTAQISGSGFVPGEVVTFQVIHTDGTAESGAGHEPWWAYADPVGGVATTWYVNPDDSLGETFQLTVASQAGTFPAALFTDSINTITINPYHTGWYRDDSNNPANQNYNAGRLAGGLYRNFFVFSVPSLSGRVMAATLSAVNPSGLGSGAGYVLWDVTTPISVLNAGGLQAGVMDDLNGGISYGSTFVSDVRASPISVRLGCAGLSAVENASGGQIAIGGDFQASSDPNFIFGVSDAGPSAVILSIQTTNDPLPTALLFPAILATYGGSTRLQATLLSNGCAVSGETINFQVDGDFVGSATTDSNGTASLLLTLGLRPTGKPREGTGRREHGTNGTCPAVQLGCVTGSVTVLRIRNTDADSNRRGGGLRSVARVVIT